MTANDALSIARQTALFVMLTIISGAGAAAQGPTARRDQDLAPLASWDSMLKRRSVWACRHQPEVPDDLDERGRGPPRSQWGREVTPPAVGHR